MDEKAAAVDLSVYGDPVCGLLCILAYHRRGADIADHGRFGRCGCGVRGGRGNTNLRKQRAT